MRYELTHFDRSTPPPTSAPTPTGKPDAEKAIADRLKLRQQIVNFWCDLTGRNEMDRRTLAVIMSYIDAEGVEAVLGWIEIAGSKNCSRSDVEMGKYISGIRRSVLNERSGR